MDGHAITVDVLQAVNARDYPRGVVIDWADDSGTNPAGRIDKDKRPKDGNGKDARKIDWLKGRTTNLSMARRNGAPDVLLIEGFCQHLAVASWAPEKYDVFGLNGCNGVHDKTDLDWAEGKRIVLGLDADRTTNPKVRAAARTAARHLYQAGAEEVRVWDLPPEVIVKENDGPDDVLARLPEDEREAAIAAWVAAAVLIPKIDEGDQFSDMAMAGVVADEVFRGKILWAHGLGWMQWTGRVWKAVDDTVPMEMIRQFVLSRYAAAAAAGQRNEVTNWGRLLSRGRGTAILAYAKGVVRVEATEMDADPDLLNCANGVVDLTTGELRPSDPDQLMTKVTRADYVRGATHADWDKALEALPEDVRDWFQLRLGQGITGHMTPDDILLVNHGGGRNGKSSVLTATSRAVGDYYRLLSDRVLMANPDAHPTELMDLKGVRYAALEETPEARRLDTQRLKKTVGTEQITARHIRQDSVTFDATHSLFVNTNHRPEITETDHASWERLALLVWPYTYRKGPEDIVGPNDRIGDPGLRDRCKRDPEIHKAALAWMVEGARRWYQRNREMPPLPDRVAMATMEWRKESDVVLAYIGEHLEFDPERHIRCSDLLASLNDWLRGREMHVWNDKTVSARFGNHDEFAQHGVIKKQQRRNDRLSRPDGSEPGDPFGGDVGSAYKAWVGVRFRSATEGPDQDHVSGVSGSPINAKATPFARVNREPETTETQQVSGSCIGAPCCGPDPFSTAIRVVIDHCPECPLHEQAA
ncbi:phage/plasmid primase, P4 family [Streptomyces sp. YU58]|uniref:DNA primase family protein n=1 Tax=Streptomyces sp. SX92 TaxID=3158972 RepID=UPI0027B900B1|nr:phage/plasmid primase, P4 family [Streptomyces coralus]WLW55565.1 phage/plasmid primase, P4 family [Streptomyces coralus]